MKRLRRIAKLFIFWVLQSDGGGDCEIHSRSVGKAVRKTLEKVKGSMSDEDEGEESKSEL
ncbi:hypothetical protein ACJRO7_033432 [Eucalyptus globulus]|uniref:Uncharacterized protein n=1 Tax=Eucalyptus globulus TaxID=34317 RepID=A0ABD3JMQ5_EUCGL